MITKQHLIKTVKDAADVLDASEIEWFCNNVIEPKRITLDTDSGEMSKKLFFQITDCENSGNSYYIVYEPIKEEFGICCITSSGNNLYLGSYGSIVDAIDNM